MFEQSIEQMKALITIEPSTYNRITSSNVGVNYEMVKNGSHNYSFYEALDIVNHIDVLLKTCSKRVYPELRSTRNTFASAFGPEMIEKVGLKSKS